MKENLKMKGGMAKIGARKSDLSKSEGGIHKQSKMKRDKRLRLYPTVLRS